MRLKTGRERRFDFQNQISTGSPEAKWMLGMLLELGDRLFDQVEHLPHEVLNAAPPGSYLTASRIILHVIQSEIRRLRLVTELEEQSYFPLVADAASENFETLQTEAIDSVEILKRHLAFRRRVFTSCCSDVGFLDEPVNDPSLPDRRAVLGHLIWHWSFHSGHIGAVTLEMGYEYNWTSAAKARSEPD